MRASIPTSGGRSGFSLTEMMIAGVILGLAVVAALTSLLFVQRSDRINSVQSELDVDARRVAEQLRRDLWRTSRDRIILFPPGPGPYTAISFPVLNRLDPDAPVPMDADGRILWDSTVIYHLWEGTSPELRITTFSPRADLTEEQRLEQFADVVEDGSGAGTHNGRNARTRTLIRNLVEWRLNIIRSRFDGYSPEPGRLSTVSLGSALLSDGPQTYTFRVADRNAASAGFRFGIDTLTVSPTAARREAEAQFPLHGHAGGTPQVVMIPGGVWSGNYRLDYLAGGVGAELTLSMRHDRWEERNFMGTGVSMDETVARFDTDLTPNAFAVQLAGKGRVWEAIDQTGDPNGEALVESELSNTAVRVILRGSEVLDGGWLNFNGQNAWIGFRSAGNTDGRRLLIQRAFIAESAGPPNLMDIVAGTRRDIRFGGYLSQIISGRRQSDKVDIVIEREKNYVIGFLVRDPDWWLSPLGNAWTWTPADGGAPSSYLIMPTSSPTTTDLLAASWSTRTDVVTSPSVFAIEYVYAGHPAEGTYTSPVFDTHLAQPAFRTLAWNALTPDESALEMRIRAGDEPDLSDAPDWAAVSSQVSGQALALNGRYIQVHARLLAGRDNLVTPKLLDLAVDWEGPTQIVDIAGAFSTGPDHGIVELLVNGTPLFQGVTVDLTVFSDVRLGGAGRRRLTASVLSEIVPRNTGR